MTTTTKSNALTEGLQPGTVRDAATLAHRIHDVAMMAIAYELDNDGNPYQAAALFRQQIRLAWRKALQDTGMDEDKVREFAFPL